MLFSDYKSTASSVNSSYFQVSRLVIIFIASILVLAILTPSSVSEYDEGAILTGAMRVAAKAVPHRDFYANYGPGQFYVLAALFDLFGQTVFVERMYSLAVRAGIVCFVYLIGSRLTRLPCNLAMTALCLLWIGVAQYPAYPIWPSLLFILVSIWVAIPVFSGTYSPGRLAFAGLCGGLSVLFRYDMGIMMLAVMSAALIAFGFTRRGISSSRVRRAFAMIAPFWGASGAVVVLLGAAYIKFGILEDFIFQIFTYPSEHYREMRSLPFPSLTLSSHINEDMIIYMPPVVITCLILLTVNQYFHRNENTVESEEIWIVYLVAFMAFGLYFKGVVRTSVVHMMSSIVPSFVVLGYVIDRPLLGKSMFARSAPMLPVLVSLIFAIVPSLIAATHARGVAFANLSDAAKVIRSGISKGRGSGDDACKPQNNLDRALCYRLSAGSIETARFIIANTTPDQRIFVGNGANDKAFANDSSLYFLSGRQPATKWSQYDPGLQNSEAIQAEMIGDLKRNTPPLIILDEQFDDEVEPNEGTKHSGVHLLDNFIHRNYERTAYYKPYTIFSALADSPRLP
jgi:hypothetical protein